MFEGCCEAKVKLTQKEREAGMEDSCHNKAVDVCEDCGKNLCRKHSDRDKHNCDDSVPGCHSIWKDGKSEGNYVKG